jgi:hypothetical protein
LTNWKLILKVQADYGYTTLQRRDQIKALQGKTAYFCDNYHAADGATHASDIKTVIVAKVGDIKSNESLLQFYWVEIDLEDASL